MILLLAFVVVLSSCEAFNGKSISLPLVDPGLFVISGVSTCGNGEGYCLLGLDCSLNEGFGPDDSGGHCEGLKTAFTPIAYFVCCLYNNSTTSDPLGISYTDPTTTDEENEMWYTVTEDRSSGASGEPQNLATVANIDEGTREKNFKPSGHSAEEIELPESTSKHEGISESHMLHTAVSAADTSLKYLSEQKTPDVNVSTVTVKTLNSDDRVTVPDMLKNKEQISENKEPPHRRRNIESGVRNMILKIQQNFLVPVEQPKLYNSISGIAKSVVFAPEQVESTKDGSSGAECTSLDAGLEEWKSLSEKGCNNKWAFFVDSRIICYGVLLNPLWILTSASCATRIFQEGLYHVTVSTMDFKDQVYGVSNVIVHENYRSPERGVTLEMNNIGLVSLSRSADISCLPCVAKKGQSFNNSQCVSQLHLNNTHLVGDPESVICEGRLKWLNTFSQTFLTLTCKPIQWYSSPDSKRMDDFYGESLWCSNVLVGIETQYKDGVITYTPISEFHDWIHENIKLYSSYT